MQSDRILLAFSAGLLFGCAEEKSGANFVKEYDHYPLVEVTDARIEDCASVYSCFSTIMEQGPAVASINGHKWVAIGGYIDRNAHDVVLELDPSEIGKPEELIRKLKALDHRFAYVRVQLNPDEPAEKLFLIPDVLESTGLRYWINGSMDSTAPNEFKGFVPSNAPEE